MPNEATVVDYVTEYNEGRLTRQDAISRISREMAAGRIQPDEATKMILALTAPTTSTENGSQSGGKCTLSHADFLAKAKPLPIVVNGIPGEATPMVFSSGAYGYRLQADAKNGGFTVTVNGHDLHVKQLGLNLLVSGSDKLDSAEAAAKSKADAKNAKRAAALKAELAKLGQ